MLSVCIYICIIYIYVYGAQQISIYIYSMYSNISPYINYGYSYYSRVYIYIDIKYNIYNKCCPVDVDLCVGWDLRTDP